MGAQAGAFDRPITIEQSVTRKTPGGFGDAVVGWVLFASPWAMRNVLRGTERQASQALEAKVDATFTLREYLPNLLPTMRLVDDDGTIYNLLAVLPAERHGGGQRLEVRNDDADE